MNDIAARMGAKMPQSLQRRLRAAYRYLSPSFPFGKIFKETYDFLEESQWWERERLEEYQLQQLSSLLRHAYDNVPYYRGVFDAHGLKPGDIQDLSDLKRLPCLTKDEFKAHFPRLVARDINTRYLPLAMTSGTSGKPLRFYTDDSVRQRELAFVFHQWSRVGYRPGEKGVELRGPLIYRRKPVAYDAASNLLRLSPRVEDMATARYYLERMQDFGASYLLASPGFAADLAYTIKKHGLVVPFRLAAVLFASEKVYDWERDIVSEVFGCRVFSFYGMTEHVIIAAECERSRAYHCCPQYGITETDPDTGELIGTGFLNHINPFIRYRTTDIAYGSSDGCDLCGRHYYPVIADVEGRLEDYFVTKRGLLVGPFIFTYFFKELRNIRESQLVQKDLDHFVVRIVPGDGDETETSADATRIRQELDRILGDDVRVDIDYVDEIERTASGKFKWMVSEVSRDLLAKGYGE